jgi:hypothetical protein
MKWTPLHFGKHKGKTLPQVVLSDPNWFFWAVSKGVFDGRSEFEAERAVLEKRARNIRIPKRRPKKWEVEYRWDRDGRFLGFSFVEAKNPFYRPLSSRLPHLDLACVRRGNIHDKRDCSQLIRGFREVYFEGLNLTKRRCEQFFENEDNFAKVGRGSVFS